MKKWFMIYSTFFYFGYFPFAPGTVGTLGGVILYFLFYGLGINKLIYCVVLLLLCAVAVVASSKAEKVLGVKDPPCVVIDEVLGFLVTMLGLALTWKILVIGFVLNRLLDIWKPFPARAIQELPGGWGIVLDDLITSAYCNLILRALIYYFNKQLL